MIKKIKLMMWKRKIKQHKGFSNETNDFIKRLVDYINSDEFKNLPIEEQMAKVLVIPQSIGSMEMLMSMHKTFNQFFDIINNSRNNNNKEEK
jgi:hypothetical protein